MKIKYQKYLYILLIIVVVFFVFRFGVQKQKFTGHMNMNSGGCGCSKGNGNKNGGSGVSTDILKPSFNLRDFCVQCTLLEDHLNDPKKRCNDCIMKHFLHADGLLSEAQSLDSKKEYTALLTNLESMWKDLQNEYSENKDPKKLAQEIRSIRKPLMPQFFTPESA